MKDKINRICTELNDGKIAVAQATEQLYRLHNFAQKRELLIAYELVNWEGSDIIQGVVEERVDNYLSNL